MIKQSLLDLIRVSGAFDLMRLISQRRALILTYHRFSADEGEGDGKTPACQFAKQLEYLTAYYDVVPLSRMVERITARAPLPSRMAAITIDDGYRDAYEIAYPLLRRYGVSATLFVVTEFANRQAWIWTDKTRFLTQQAAPQRLTMKIRKSEMRLDLNGATSRRNASEHINSIIKRLPDDLKEETINSLSLTLDVAIPRTPPEEFSSVTWDQARKMRANGVEIGSHTLTHPILTKVGDERLQRELRDSKSQLEEVLGHQVDLFCYPNGDNDERVQREVARAGYRAAVTVVNGLNRRGDDPLTLRRVHTERDFTHFLQSVSGFEQLKNRLRLISSSPTGNGLRSGKIE
ncbi:MAG TPA: polysaccharide deacetylase family protein [Blastocatellia bacterium]|nr:polysaccharide deacetylase family protein [Blastocatellia bacterium]